MADTHLSRFASAFELRAMADKTLTTLSPLKGGEGSYVLPLLPWGGEGWGEEGGRAI
jgi:hypothetical protein